MKMLYEFLVNQQSRQNWNVRRCQWYIIIIDFVFFVWALLFYRVYQSELVETKWPWGIEGSISFLIRVLSGFKWFGHLSFFHLFLKKQHRLASNRKGAKIQYDISRFYQNIFFQNMRRKLNSRNCMTWKHR